jgi:tetratricopeptide (TPR) repeat protein
MKTRQQRPSNSSSLTVCVEWSRLTLIQRSLQRLVRAKILLYALVSCLSGFVFMLSSHLGYAQNIDSLRHVVERAANDSAKVDLLCSIANTLARSVPEQSLEFGTQALAIAQTLNSTRGKALATYTIANAHYRLGNYPSALEYCSQSRSLYEELKDKQNMARCMNRIGTIYKNQQNYKQARTFAKAKKVSKLS